jgi:hypothetical protein
VKISLTEQFADAMTMQPAQMDRSRVAAFTRPGAAAGVVGRDRRRAGYLGARLMPPTWQRFGGEVCPLPAIAIRKHAHSTGPSTWSPPV